MIELDIPKAVTEAKGKKIKVYPCHVNRASSMGDPCERRLVLERTSWQEKKAHDVGLQYIFDEGNLQERAVLNDLEDAGIHVIEQQRSFSWDKYKITGHIDGKVVVDGKAPPLEIKSMSPNIWRVMQTEDDLKKYPWTARYRAQMQLYLLMAEEEEGILIFKNKSTGQLKQINIALDYDFAESLIQKAERINGHIEKGTLPDYVEDKSLCAECAFVHVCCPKIDYGEELEIVNDGELIEMLNRLEELKPLKSEYDRLVEDYKAFIGGRENVMAGDWHITFKESERAGFTVAPGKTKRFKIERVIADKEKE